MHKTYKILDCQKCNLFIGTIDLPMIKWVMHRHRKNCNGELAIDICKVETPKTRSKIKERIKIQ